MTPPVPILQTCFSRSWGGLEIQALEVTAQLARRLSPVTLACCTGSRLAEEARSRSLRVAEFEVSGYFHPAALWRLSRHMRAEAPRIIHCQHSKDLSVVVPAAQISGTKPKILLSKRVGSYVSKRDPFHRFTYSRVARVLAISEVIHRNVLDTTPMEAQRVVTLHDAIDADEFSPAKGRGAALREEFGYSKENIVVGFVGRFSPGKGHEELLHAAESILRVRPHVRFLVAGEASAGEEAYEQEIRALCRSLGIESAVTFAGFRRDIPDVMASFDILAFPSHAESFGVVLIEAMAMELPVVSTNCDGVLDIVVEGETGLYVPPRAPGELAGALLRLIDDADLRARLGHAGRKRVLALFDRRNQIDRLEKIYAEVIAEPGP
ncbi:MAG TPA: glycosyltransferase family 4 protein [Bacteroidota bacterium]|nr:glycosyltransferase family 4 protein [Bacteroidota bacterium]